MMIDFKITSKLTNYYMEHCHGDYEKMSLIQKLYSDTLYDNLKPEQHYLPGFYLLRGGGGSFPPKVFLKK